MADKTPMLLLDSLRLLASYDVKDKVLWKAPSIFTTCCFSPLAEMILQV